MKIEELIIVVNQLTSRIENLEDQNEILRRAMLIKKNEPSSFEHYFTIYLVKNGFTPLNEIFEQLKDKINFAGGVILFSKELKKCGYKYAVLKNKRGFYVTINNL